ncbi:MAG: Asp-tRNA(Asn)/Glu-tRNA(Gln) amidotransferase subunit GatC [Candidatus Saccharimonadales bacterium]
MANLTRADVLKLAQLARLQLDESELDGYVKELTAILDYVEQLSEVEISELEPTQQVTGLTDVTRPDDIIDYGYEVNDLLKNVPVVSGNQIKVKRMIG